MTESPRPAPRLPPIPTPPRQLWRLFGNRIVPPLTFLAVLATTAWYWQNNLAAFTFLGSGEARQAVVSSPSFGTIVTCHVQPFQSIQKGDPVVTLLSADLRAPLEILRLRLQVAASQLQPTIGQRNAVDFERLRLEGLRLRVELASAKVDLERAESELSRAEKLLKEKLVSTEAYEAALKARDSLRVEVEQKPNLISAVEDSLTKLRSIADPFGGTHQHASRELESLEAEISSLTTNQGRFVLSAPISGKVSSVLRGEGENVTAGEGLVFIQAQRAERIVGYLRQPYRFEPTEGMRVEIRTRNLPPQRSASQIHQVGAHLQVITNSLAILRPGSLVDFGLPVVVGIPNGLNLRPGEVVELTLLPKSTIPDSNED